MTDLSGQTVLVTDANRGVGREFVSQLLERGVAGVYAGARDPGSVDVSDPRVTALQLDVTDADSIAAAAASAGDVSVVINNAGISVGASVLDADPEGLRRELEVNLLGPLAVTAAFVQGVTERGGAILNVASVLSWLPLGGTYTVAKAGLWAATDSMRLELQPKGVQVVGLYMGYVDTDMTVGIDEPKSTPAQIVRQALDGIESGAAEVLADDIARGVRAGLHLPFDERMAALSGPA